MIARSVRGTSFPVLAFPALAFPALALPALALLAACGTEPDLGTVDRRLFTSTPAYATSIAPLLRRYCVECHDQHGPNHAQLDSCAAALASSPVRIACVAVTRPVIDRFESALTLPGASAPCTYAGGAWAPDSMPRGASGLRLDEQVILARWAETSSTTGCPP